MLSARASFVALLVTFSAGCNMTQLAAGSTVKIIGQAWPAVERYEDPDLAGEGIPASISTMEGLLQVRPDDAELRGLLARAYGSYGFGFMEDRMEAALLKDDDEGSEYFRKRAAMAYTRCQELALGTLTQWEEDGGGAAGHIKQGLDSWTGYLKKFDDAEKHVPTLFWGAYCWGRYIGINRDDVNALADLPLVTALSDRVLALDHTYFGYAPHALRAGLIGTAPAQLGGRPDEAKKEFETAINATQGKNLMYHVIEAQIVAVALQDRALYKKLLTTVTDAPKDLNPEGRLINQLAKRRAERYLSQTDKLFAPEEPPAEAPAAPASAAPPAPAPPAAPAAKPPAAPAPAAKPPAAPAPAAKPPAAPSPKH